MDSDGSQFVPKVHPATRAIEQDDPMTIHATPVAGDPEAMIGALIEEYAGMGWGIDPILRLFRDPSYPMLHAFWQSSGDDAIRERIEAACRRRGHYQFRATVWEAPEEPEPQLVQIGPLGPEVGHHADRH